MAAGAAFRSRIVSLLAHISAYQPAETWQKTILDAQ